MIEIRCCLSALIFFVSVAPLLAQTTKTNLLDAVNPAEHAVSGTWERSKSGLAVKAGRGSRFWIPVKPGSDYSLRVEFTRTSGDDAVTVMIPVGKITATVELSGWNGQSHGLVKVDGQPSKSVTNPTSVRPGPLKNGQRYRLDIRVKQDGDKVRIETDLDEKQLFAWTGAVSRLQPHFVFRLPETGTMGLGAMDSAVVFHSVRLLSGKSSPVANTIETLKANVAKRIDLQGLADAKTADWEAFSGAMFQATKNNRQPAIASIANAGSGDRGAFLKNIRLATGVIEIDLKGSKQLQKSFLGVVFHAVDGETYEAVYFRPFRFGDSDPVARTHAVQYIAHPGWTWKRLRGEKAGQYESRVTPEPQPEEWFHARIELTGNRVRVFVNDSKTACLDVERLGKRTSGKVGLWFNGIAEFSGLTIMPTK